MLVGSGGEWPTSMQLTMFANLGGVTRTAKLQAAVCVA